MVDELWSGRLGCLRRARGRTCGVRCLTLTFLSQLSVSVSAQTLAVTPDAATTFSFAGFEGGPFDAETGTVWTLDNADFRALDFVIADNQRWLVVAPPAGTLPGAGVLNRRIDVVATVNEVEAAKLAPGLYSATVTFLNVTTELGNTTRTVRLRVAPASFSVSPSFVNPVATLNAAGPSPVAVTLRANGQTDLNYRITWVTRSWFNVDKVSGTVPGGGGDTFSVSFNTVGLTAGTYTAQIRIDNTTNGVGSRDLPISLVVQSVNSGVVTLRPDVDLEVRGPAGNLPPAVQSSTLSNSGDEPVLWNASANEDWVSISPSGGQLAASNGAAGGPDEVGVEVRVNAAADDLEAGSRTAVVTFENVSTPASTVTIGTRIIHVIVDPVLTVSVPNSGGTVAVAPSGATVAAGASTELVFSFGDVVTLTAAAAAGFEFQGWTADFNLDSEQANPLVVALEKSRGVSAVFVPVLRELNLSTTGLGAGTVGATPAGVVIDNDVISRYKNGTQVRLQAEADAGSEFVGWEGNVPAGMDQGNPLTVPMDRDRTISARFEAAATVVVEVTGGGSVRIEPQQETYTTGSDVTLVAEADEGFVFSGWSGDAEGSATPLTLTLTGDAVVGASFVVDPGPVSDAVLLTVETEGDGSVTPDGGEFEAGETVSFIATPDIGASFVGWEGDASGTELTTTVTMDTDRTVRAVFTAAPSDDPTDRPTPGLPGFGALCGATGLVEMLALYAGLRALSVRGVGWRRRNRA